MSTLPKSIQAAQAASAADGQTSTPAALREKRLACRELANKYKRLPDDFLRIPLSYYSDSQNDQMIAATAVANRALNLTQQQASLDLYDFIEVSVVEAQLVKNYGLLRMDLYCKVRVGHVISETSTCPNGAKNPKWHGVHRFALASGIDSFHLEIYDEKQFSPDEKIAWLHEPIPPEIFQGITVERWFPLSGRSGPLKEGSVLLVISHKREPLTRATRSFMSHYNQLQQQQGPIILGGRYTHSSPAVDLIPTYIQPPPAPQQQPPPPSTQVQTNQTGQQIQSNTAIQSRETPAPTPMVVPPASEEDISQLSEMFPSIDKAIIKAILENNHHDKDASIGALLAMG